MSCIEVNIYYKQVSKSNLMDRNQVFEKVDGSKNNKIKKYVMENEIRIKIN